MKILREPLFHFLLLGCVLFLLYGLSNEGQWADTDDIVIDQRRIDALSAQFELVWQRPPSTDELGTLVRNWVREEVLYREGLAQGFDRNDPVIRRRVAQNMELLGSSVVPATPSEEELYAWLQANADNYLTPTRYSFSQLYFDPDRDAADLAMRFAAAREQILSGMKPLAADATLLPHEFVNATLPKVAGTFGTKFAAALEKLTPGDWAGPVESEYGLHLVLVERVTPGRLPGLTEIRSLVANDYLYTQFAQANDDFYRGLRARYSIEIEAGPLTASDL